MVLRVPQVFKHANSSLKDHAKPLPMSCVRLKMKVAYFQGTMMDSRQSILLPNGRGMEIGRKYQIRTQARQGKPYVL